MTTFPTAPSGSSTARQVADRRTEAAQRALSRGIPGERLGPIARFGAQFFVFASLFVAFRADGFKYVPGKTPLALLVGTLPILLLTPTAITKRFPVSLAVLAMIGWEVASVLWTDSPQGTNYALRIDVPVAVGMVLICGILPLRDLAPTLVWLIRFIVVFTVFALLTDPTTRTHIDNTGAANDLAGWHGYFPHKNTMGPFLAFAVPTVLTFDRSKVIRWVTVAAIGVLLVGSDSVTGMTGALLAVSVWVWLQLWRNLDMRNSSIFLVSSISVAGFGLLGILATLSSVLGGAGKDVTVSGRTFIWRATLAAWRERPFTGYGLSGVLGREPITPKTAEIWRAIGFQAPHAHNGLIDIGLQLGVVGVVLYAILFFSTLLSGLSMLRDRPKLGAWIVGVMLVQIYMSLSEPVFLVGGWLPTLLMFRMLSLRRDDLDFNAGSELGERLRRLPMSMRYARR